MTWVAGDATGGARLASRLQPGPAMRGVKIS